MRSQTGAEWPVPRSPRYDSLDMWRGIACLAVIVFHATNYSPPDAHATGFEAIAVSLMYGCRWLWAGVPMFFVISGYCIAAAVDSSRRKPGASPRFFIRRFFRIYPPYWVWLGISFLSVSICEQLIWPGLFADRQHPQWSLSPQQWLGNLSLTESWRSHVFGDDRAYFLGQSWTLCYEEQFYLVCGLLLLVCPRQYFAATGVMSILVMSFVVVARQFNVKCGGFFCDGHWFLFASGILVYFHVNYATRRLRRMIEAVLVCGLLACWSDPFHHWTHGSLEQQGLIAFGFGLTLIMLQKWDQRIACSRWTQPLQYCGVMCYSLYLVHWPTSKAISHMLYLAGLHSNSSTLLVTVPACLAVSLMMAWPFHVFIERRCLNGYRSPRLTTAAVNVPNELSPVATARAA